MSSPSKAIQRARRVYNRDRRIAYLGDGTGEVHDLERPGNYFVRFPQGIGGYGPAISLPFDVNANLLTDDGTAVEIGERNGQPIILGVHREGLTAAGINPQITNPKDPTNMYTGPIHQDQITTFWATRHGDPAKLFTAVVLPGIRYVLGVPYLFEGAEIDLSSFQPSAGNHAYVSVFIKTDLTLEAFASTAINSADPLSGVDIQETVGLMTAGSFPVWAWDLSGDDTALTVDKARQVDLRQAVGPGAGTGGVGTVTSVGISFAPTGIFDVTSTPVTSSGVIALSMDTQAANLVLAGPTTGAAAVPAFRSLVVADIPDISTVYLPIQPGADWTVDASGLRMGAIGGAAVAAQKLTIHAGADANKGVQIRQFSATHSGNLLELATSAGTLISAFDSAGRLGVGATPGANVTITATSTFTDTVTQAHAGINAICIGAPTGHSAGNFIGIIADGRMTTDNNLTASSGGIRGVSSTVRFSGAGTVTLAQGNLSVLQHTGTGTLTTFNYFHALQPTLSGGGLIGAINGLKVENIGAAGVTTATGVLISSQSGASNNFALQTNAGNVVFNEGGDANTVFRVEGDTDINLICTAPATDAIGFGTASANTKVHMLRTGAGTNAVVNVLTVGHDTTGTAAAGFGTGLIFEGESSTTASQSMGRLTYEWATATHATRKARGKLTVFDTAERDAITFEADGSLPLVGIGTSGTPGALLDINGFYRWAGTKRVSTQFDKTSSAVLADITGLSATVIAGKTYSFRAILHETGGAGGHKYAISGTATATAIIYDIHTVDMTSQLIDICVRATALDTSGGEATGSDHYTSIEGLITVNAGGTLTVQFAQNASNGATSSILVGSTFFVWEVA